MKDDSAEENGARCECIIETPGWYNTVVDVCDIKLYNLSFFMLELVAMVVR